MCLCFYLFIAGLILLSSLVDDFVHIRTYWRIVRNDQVREAEASGSAIIRALSALLIAGLLVAISMKLRAPTRYTFPNIWDWLISDARSVLSPPVLPAELDVFSKPNQYTSLLVVLLVSTIYLYGTIRIGASVSAGHSLVRAI